MAREKLVRTERNFRRIMHGFFSEQTANAQMRAFHHIQPDLERRHHRIGEIERAKLERQRNYHRNRNNSQA